MSSTRVNSFTWTTRRRRTHALNVTQFTGQDKTRRYRCARYLLRAFDFLLFYLETMRLYSFVKWCALSFDVFAERGGSLESEEQTRRKASGIINYRCNLVRDRHSTGHDQLEPATNTTRWSSPIRRWCKTLSVRQHTPLTVPAQVPAHCRYFACSEYGSWPFACIVCFRFIISSVKSNQVPGIPTVQRTPNGAYSTRHVANQRSYSTCRVIVFLTFLHLSTLYEHLISCWRRACRLPFDSLKLLESCCLYRRLWSFMEKPELVVGDNAFWMKNVSTSMVSCKFSVSENFNMNLLW